MPNEELHIGQKSEFPANNLHFRFTELLTLEITPKPQENQGTYPRSQTHYVANLEGQLPEIKPVTACAQLKAVPLRH